VFRYNTLKNIINTSNRIITIRRINKGRIRMEDLRGGSSFKGAAGHVVGPKVVGSAPKVDPKVSETSKVSKIPTKVPRKLSYAQVARGSLVPPFISCFNLRVLKGKLVIPLEIIKSTIEDGTCNLVGQFPGLRLDIDPMRDWAF